jgi:hypothetical protein
MLTRINALKFAALLLAACGASFQAVAATSTFTGNTGCSSSTQQPDAYSFGSTVSVGGCTTQDQGFSFAEVAFGVLEPGTRITSIDGSLFSISSLDVGNGPNRVDSRNANEDVRWSQGLTFTGTYADGTTVTFSFQLDGANGFETVALPGSFSNLSSLEVRSTAAVRQVTTLNMNGQATGGFNQFAPGTAFLDNVALTSSAVTPVPEPSTVALLGLPLAVMLFTARRRQRLAKDADAATTPAFN